MHFIVSFNLIFKKRKIKNKKRMIQISLGEIAEKQFVNEHTLLKSLYTSPKISASRQKTNCIRADNS